MPDNQVDLWQDHKMVLAVQFFEQSENMADVVAPKVEMHGFSPQDLMKVRVDIPVARLVLEVALVGPKAELVKVDLEDCKATLVGSKKIPGGPKVVPVRVVFVGHMHTLAGPKVVPKRVFLVGRKHILAEPKVFSIRVVLVG